MDAMTTKKAGEDWDELIERVITDMQPTILCLDLGSRAVLMSLDEFTAWQETLYLLSNPHLLSSIQSAQAGQVVERELI